MENKTVKYIRAIERVFESKELTEEQRKTLAEFDRFNELEAQCCENTRRAYLEVLHELGKNFLSKLNNVTRNFFACVGDS